MFSRVLDGFADRDAETAGAMRILCEHLAAVIRQVARTRMHRRTPRVHEHPAIRLLLITHLDHVNVAFEAEKFARQRERRTPLARAGLGGETLRAGDLVEVRLRDGSVDLVTAGGADA